MNTHDTILYLTMPKLLSVATLNNSESITSLKDPADRNSFIGTNQKRTEVDQKSIDFLVSKKGKYKQRKKGRSKSYQIDSLPTIKNGLSVSKITSVAFVSNSKDVKDKKTKSKNYQLDDGFFQDSGEVKEIYLGDPLTLQELAAKLTVPSSDIIKWLFLKGISATINQFLDTSTATLVAEHYLFNVLRHDNKIETLEIDPSSQQLGRSRSPIITLLGHVDHGKTALLRAIRQDDFESQEAGSITQSICSYEVLRNSSVSTGKLIFLDTPGHAAFTSMRKRSASITDIVVLVVSADDGLQPQTTEAIEYIQSRNIPFIVAINKIDKPEADIAKVKNQLADFNILDTGEDDNRNIVGVSALKCKNIDQLLRAIVALSKAQNLKSDPSAPAEGTILEAYLNKKKGPVAQLLVRNGTLRIGDVVLAGHFYGKVKAISGSINRKMKLIESVALADVLCFAEVPTAGLSFKVVADEKEAKNLLSNYIKPANFTALNSRISLDDASQKHVKKIIKQVNLIIKTSVQGTIDAIVHTLAGISQEKVQINLLLAASGEVALKDIELAFASNSLILAFGLNVPSSTIHNAEKRGVAIYAFSVIYDLIDHVKNHMLSFVDLDYEKEIIGYAQVKSLFVVNKGIVAGCFIETGKLQKNAYFQVKRAGRCVYTGLIDSLKRVKDDTDEVNEGNECGVMCENYDSWEIGDLLECYELKSLEKTL